MQASGQWVGSSLAVTAAAVRAARIVTAMHACTDSSSSSSSSKMTKGPVDIIRSSPNCEKIDSLTLSLSPSFFVCAAVYLFSPPPLPPPSPIFFKCAYRQAGRQRGKEAGSNEW